MVLTATNGEVPVVALFLLYKEDLFTDKKDFPQLFSKLCLQTWLMMIWFWVISFPVTKAATQAKIAESSVGNIYLWLRDACSWKLVQTKLGFLGGPRTR